MLWDMCGEALGAAPPHPHSPEPLGCDTGCDTLLFGFALRLRSRFGFRVESLGFKIQGFGLRVSGLGFRVWGFGFRVSGFGFRVQDQGFWICYRV